MEGGGGDWCIFFTKNQNLKKGARVSDFIFTKSPNLFFYHLGGRG